MSFLVEVPGFFRFRGRHGRRRFGRNLSCHLFAAADLGHRRSRAAAHSVPPTRAATLTRSSRQALRISGRPAFAKTPGEPVGGGSVRVEVASPSPGAEKWPTAYAPTAMISTPTAIDA
jgi:hypothetical protein